MKIQHTETYGIHRKAVLREKFVPVNDDLVKEERSQINNINFYLKTLREKEQAKSKTSRKNEIKIRAEINEWNRKGEKQERKISETKS